MRWWIAFLLLLLFGCGGGGSGGTSNAGTGPVGGGANPPPPPQVGDVLLRFTLQPRAIPSEVLQLRLTAFNFRGQSVKGPQTFPKASVITWEDVPTSATTLQIEYLDSLRVLGIASLPLAVQPGRVVEIVDPDFQDVPATLQRLEIEGPVDSPVGIEASLTARGFFNDNTSRDLTASVTWSSSNPLTASIQAGIVVPREVGEVNITAQLGEISTSRSFRAVEARLTSIEVSPADQSLARGTLGQVQATGSFSDGSSRPLTTQVTWSSSAPGFVAVSNGDGLQGQLSALSEGTATITASLGGIEGTASVTTTAAVLQQIQVSPPNQSLAKGTGGQVQATGIYSDGSSQPLTTQVTWNSSAPAQVAVSNADGTQGQLSALSEGTATITASLGGIEGTASVTTTAATPTVIWITPQQGTVLVGDQLPLKATARLTDNSVVDITTLAIWTSLDESRATVDNQGRVSGVALGVVSIRADYQGVQGEVSVLVGYGSLALPNMHGFFSSVSFTGRQIAYAQSRHIVWRDLDTGAEEFLEEPSVFDLGYSALYPSMSDDAQSVVFFSYRPDLSTFDPGEQPDLYVRHRASGSLTRVSENDLGERADQPTGRGRISRNGSHAIFTSRATNLVAGDSNGFGDVFVKDLQTGEIDLVSRNSLGDPGNSSSEEWDFFSPPDLSADGRYAVFDSAASNLASGDTNNRRDVFLHDRSNGETRILSLGTVVAHSFSPRISSDGSRVIFQSEGPLIAADTNGRGDIYLWERSSGTLSLVSTTSTGALGNHNSALSPSLPHDISADGRFVSFSSQATNFVADTPTTPPGVNLFLKDLHSGEIRLIPRTPTGAAAATLPENLALLSGNGQLAFFFGPLSTFVPGGAVGVSGLIQVFNALSLVP